jgi:hypothetical protein
MEGTRVARHVWAEAYLAVPEAKTSAANAVAERNQREASGVEDVFEGSVALAQYRGLPASTGPGKIRDCAAN